MNNISNNNHNNHNKMMICVCIGQDGKMLVWDAFTTNKVCMCGHFIAV